MRAGCTALAVWISPALVHQETLCAVGFFTGNSGVWGLTKLHGIPKAIYALAMSVSYVTLTASTTQCVVHTECLLGADRGKP